MANRGRPKIKDGTVKVKNGKKYIRVNGRWKVNNTNLIEPETEPKPEPKPEPKQEPKPEPKPEPEPTEETAPKIDLNFGELSHDQPQSSNLESISELEAMADQWSAEPEQSEQEPEPDQAPENLDADAILLLTEIALEVILPKALKCSPEIWKLEPHEKAKLKALAQKMEVAINISPGGQFAMALALMSLPRIAETFAEKKAKKNG